MTYSKSFFLTAKVFFVLQILLDPKVFSVEMRGIELSKSGDHGAFGELKGPGKAICYNLTFSDDINLHSTNPDRPNDYRDLIKLIASSYANVTNLPIFGFGAKTSKYSSKATGMFPITRSIRNPFTPNDDETLMKTYTDCL